MNLSDFGNKIVYTDLLSDEDKFKLSEDTIFDRVINLKFTTEEFTLTDSAKQEKVVDEFVIRSDYEVYYPGETVKAIMNSKLGVKKGYVRRCSIKPSIKVTYNQTSAGTVTAIDIYVSNFFILTKDGRNLMSFNQQTYDIAHIDIQMGYIGQFNALLGIDPTSVKGTIYNLDPSVLYDFSRTGHGVETIRISNVEYVKTEKTAPDYTLHIHGYVGSTIDLSKEGISNDYGEKQKDTVTYKDITTEAKESKFSFTSDGAYPDLFFKYITKRYLNGVKDIPAGTKPGEDGFYDDAIAKLYGIKVYCSDEVKNLIPIKDQTDAQKKVVDTSTYYIQNLGGKRNTAISALQRLTEKTNNNLLYARLNNGDFLVYLKSEIKGTTIKNLSESFEQYINNNQAHDYFRNILPAVNNINIDGVATIVCPFFTWVNPFQQLQFASRYVSSTLTSFYAGFTAQITYFYAINVIVSFATVEDVNEMQITAVPDVNS